MTPYAMGDTGECLAHFRAKFPTDSTRPLLAEFCHVTTDTVGRWFNGRNLPVGEELIRLRIFLALANYRVSELDDLSKSLRELAQVIALDVMTPDEVRQALGYKNIQDVYRVVLRGTGLMADKVRKLARILGETRDNLDKRLAMWNARLEDVIADAVNAPRGRQAPPAPVSTIVETLGVSNEAVVIDHLVAALSAVLDNGSKGRSTSTGHFVPEPLPEERIRLIQEFVDDSRLRRLITQLEMLG